MTAAVKIGVGVTIDAENISPKNIHVYLKKVAAYENIIIKEAYGSCKLLASQAWKNALLLLNYRAWQVLNVKKERIPPILKLRSGQSKPDLICIVSGDTDYSLVMQKLRSKKEEVLVIAKEVYCV